MATMRGYHPGTDQYIYWTSTGYDGDGSEYPGGGNPPFGELVGLVIVSDPPASGGGGGDLDYGLLFTQTAQG